MVFDLKNMSSNVLNVTKKPLMMMEENYIQTKELYLLILGCISPFLFPFISAKRYQERQEVQ